MTDPISRTHGGSSTAGSTVSKKPRVRKPSWSRGKRIDRICDYCGKLYSAKAAQVAKGRGRFCSKSCGAHVSKNKKHGLTGTQDHTTWLDMRERCRNPRCQDYRRYGDRGITFCERWDSFETFMADMGPRPTKNHSLGRIDNDGNYEPGNCQWETRLQQSRNRSMCYTPAQDVMISEMRAGGSTYREIGKVLGKSPEAISTRCYRLRDRETRSRVCSERA